MRRWLDMLARNLIMDAEELEEHGEALRETRKRRAKA